VGQISDYTFHVPLLIYAPQTLTHTVRVTNATSHIDFAPTLLALLGDTDAAARMQGIPIWQRRTSDRIYLLGSAYGGADGFVQGGTYFMRQSMSGAVYRSPDFTFGEEDQARPGDPVIRFVSDALEQIQELQHTIVGRMLSTPVESPTAR
jgi:arylsulfatase A-like enzyme